MPVVVYVLGLSIFGLGTTEFMIAGLLPLIADDLDVSVPAVGGLISAFAIGMVIGAPALTAASLRLPRKTTLIGALVLFIAGQALGALAPNYGVLLVARVVTAVATGAFWGVASVTAVRAVPPERTARALAVLLGGLTIANVLGVPAGTWIGQSLGWRATFWAVAIVAAISLVGVVALVPAGGRTEQPPRLRDELRTFRNGRLWVALATTVLYGGAIFGAFSYAAPLITDVADLPESAVPAILLLFGVGAFLGNVIGARVADRGMLTNLHVSFGALVVVMAALGTFAGSAVAAVVLLFAMGVTGYSAAAALNGRVFQLSAKAPTLASAVNTSAFNVGNTIGPWIGGAAISAGFGYRAPVWVGVALLLGALALTFASRALDAREAAPAPEPALAV
ncbi:Cmx/CmrA family chloramphenicol efflux MFS transporter [Cryptosporangium aurantiacum]|uniref:MFS transporter, DHA1 family, chloramphenicol resistance protein n=1 Tax=Cryptosporangium aurantiacum TaxID=134849 RepID=A0A1M7RML4_9ACTN|nr:Cmx/CmrA family chloramphenicol efflux MFS transporter [Cryptosporangium aurantiacum]SHN47420.1 MFS transporter, DHA1 family, chloramphenicol resistance protein [Cryptosporangium aurantiacum]